jgi:membrane protein DedA with SNARE-associated domain
MAWLVRPSRDAGFATLPAPAGALLGAGTAFWFGRWRAGPFRGDDRVELGPQ